jgi:DNA polymerase III alpha subunit
LNEQACLSKDGRAFFAFQAGAPVFVHLHCHSHYSFLRGVASPEEIIAAAAEQQMPAVALTDTDGLYAAVPFYQAAKKAGVKPIVGAALDVEW